MNFNFYSLNILCNQIPSLLDELDLLPSLARKLIEKDHSSSILLTEEEQINNLQRFLRRENIENQMDLEKWLAQKNTTEVALSHKLYRIQQIEKLKISKFSSKVQSVFLERKSNLDRVMYSMIRSKQKEKIAEIFLRIEDKEDTFADLASKFSEGIENQVNGLIGPIELGLINPHIAERLKISQRGQLWEPFQVDGWWVILRLERLLAAKLDENMHKKLIHDLYEEWIKNEICVVMREYYADAKNKQVETSKFTSEDNTTRAESVIESSAADRFKKSIKKFLPGNQFNP